MTDAAFVTSSPHTVLGLTTDSALKLPFFRHCALCWICKLEWFRSAFFHPLAGSHHTPFRLIHSTPLSPPKTNEPLTDLASIGTVPASSHVAKKWLERGWSIGISSGGVAEIFEANNPDEVILMQERKGFIKLALKTGVPVAPCYIFGNTKLMSCWYDQGGVLQGISRRLKAGFLPIWGRWGLPIFFRQPITGVVGHPIRVPKVEGEPSQEMIDKYHAQFVDELVKLFNRYRALYGNGFETKKLLIK